MISLACRPPFATPTANNIAIGLSMPGWRRRWPGPAAGAEMLGGGLIAVSALWCECHLALHTSFPPGLTRPTAHETYFATLPDVVGTEVGIRLVRLSPHISWTRGSWSTSDCRHGPPSAPEHAF